MSLTESRHWVLAAGLQEPALLIEAIGLARQDRAKIEAETVNMQSH